MPRTKKMSGPKFVDHNKHLNTHGFLGTFTEDDAPSGVLRKASHNLSLAEEARFTERNQGWKSDLKLRHIRVNFVSANNVGEVLESSISKQGSTSETSYTITKAVENDPGSKANIQDQTSSADLVLPSDNVLTEHGTAELTSLIERSKRLMLGSAGSAQQVTSGLPTPRTQRSPSPALSDSSEEVVVFRGRGNSKQSLQGTHQFSDNTSQSHNTRDTSSIKTELYAEHHVRRQIRAYASEGLRLPTVNTEKPPSYLQNCLTASMPLRTASWVAEKHFGLAHAGDAFGKRHRRRRGRVRVESEEEEAIIKDYILNMQNNEDELKSSADSTSEKQNTTSFDLDSTRKINEPSSGVQTHRTSNLDWSDGDLHDLHEISTSSELFETVEVILSKRERPTGCQYLVVWKGHTTDDARWVPFPVLVNAGASDSIASFETHDRFETHNQIDYTTSPDSNSGDDDLARDLEDDFRDAELDDILLEKLQARMSDEQIAQRLAKQEELGLGSNKIMLFDGQEPSDPNAEEPAMVVQEKAATYGSAASVTKKQLRGQVMSMSAYASVLGDDPYNGFDVMDHERLSLRGQTKGRRKVPLFENSDPDLEISMLLAWENDRKKKKVQKQLREDRRAQGLLGKGGKLDIKAKYPEGMTITELKRHIKEFLNSDSMSTPFPPMDKNARLIVHNFANALNLKSKSVGGGKSRYPVLYKTARTMPYSEVLFENVEARVNQTFLPRMDKRGKKAATIRKTGAKRGGGGIGTSVSYRDGEIVGAAAPEIGVENRGRAMLEKMGWSTGTALGALNNKGIMQPVVHVVKTTRAGLG